LEHALGIVFAQPPHHANAPNRRSTSSAFHTLCKVMAGESVTLAEWTEECSRGNPSSKTPKEPFGVLPPGLRSLDLLRSCFDIATATNSEIDVGLMTAEQLADATSALARELGVAPATGLSKAEAAAAMGRVARVPGSGASATTKAGLPDHIEFTQFVVVCVHFLGAPGS
jgi:hypothetical protein